MKYTPKLLDESKNPNRPKKKIWRELLELLCSLLLIALAFYFILGLLVGFVVGRLSPSTVQSIEKQFSAIISPSTFGANGSAEAEKELQRILDGLQQGAPIQRKVHLVEDEMVNAVALPNGDIVVFSGLLRECKSENELAMVLGHELGHFEHRDHLRALGRGIVLLTVSTITLGGNDSVSRLIQNSISTAEMKFSRNQESAADLFGIERVVRQYGHVSGSLDFFKRIGEKDKSPQWATFLLSHPAPLKRVAELEAYSKTKGYKEGEKSTLPAELKGDKKK